MPAAEYHEPVLVREVVDLLLSSGGGLFLDGTVGGGGHAAALLGRCEGCRLIGVDRDPEALERAAEVLAPFQDRVRLVRARFDRAMGAAGLMEPLAGALLDLGVSSRQLDADPRGFTFRPGVPLDMRMGDDGERSAADLLAELDEADLARLLHRFGEEPRARRVAAAVVARRRNHPLRTSDDLLAALEDAYGRPPSMKERARVWQALRIAVNAELEALEAALPALREALRPGGVLAVIAYHSLEDRIVKQAFREWSRDCVCPPGMPVCRCRGRAFGSELVRRPVRPAADEVERNPRARSARLRAWRKGEA
ncbi:MAG: 16S rRNA (cytosine(1402)-N(4))-methyltransferase RsmH [Gemmatimonadetes bacterium]|nr:MAG: 16S rRNA (cytosine(1402)-N(4))-methyltransferase RsmH [Gemmatimonadota bacterium]